MNCCCCCCPLLLRSSGLRAAPSQRQRRRRCCPLPPAAAPSAARQPPPSLRHRRRARPRASGGSGAGGERGGRGCGRRCAVLCGRRRGAARRSAARRGSLLFCVLCGCAWSHRVQLHMFLSFICFGFHPHQKLVVRFSNHPHAPLTHNHHHQQQLHYPVTRYKLFMLLHRHNCAPQAPNSPVDDDPSNILFLCACLCVVDLKIYKP